MWPAALLSVVSASLAAAGAPVTYIDLRHEGLPARISVLVCSGLYNRDESRGGAVYTLLDPAGGDPDTTWLADIDGVTDPPLTTAADFVAACVETRALGYIRYNATAQQLVTPNIITLAAVLDAVPLEDGDPAVASAPMLFDAVKTFDGMDARGCTEYMFDHYANQTTGLAKMNPGLDVHGNISWQPPLIPGQLHPGLTDFIVKEKLFNFFLENGCIPLTREYALESRIMRENPWPRPVTVYGYDDTWGFVAGDPFEAETDCGKEHNMGQVASDDCNNLAYFSRKPSKPPITSPLKQNPDPSVGKYNKSKTYVAFVVGDGDSIKHVKGIWADTPTRYQFKDRVKRCAARPRSCYPLLWSMAPQTLHLAPDWLRWYYNQSYQTQSDWFVLPPSGDTYSYPGEMHADDQAAFVRHTERDCELMSTSASVHWEWTLTWPRAMKEFFPRYAERGIVRGLFAVNVPFLLPAPAFGLKEYLIFGGKVVVFRPREWRGATCGQGCETPENMAAKINGYAPGTVTHLYTTTDGGWHLPMLDEMVAHLDEHVEVVNHNVLIDFALQRGE